LILAAGDIVAGDSALDRNASVPLPFEPQPILPKGVQAGKN
jgi:hypothetical protein